MASTWLCFAAFIAAVIMKTAAAGQGEETNIVESATVPNQPLTDSDLDPNSDFVRQLTEKHLRQGESFLKSMQAYLAKIRPLVSAGSSRSDPVPSTADVMRTLSGAGTTPEGDSEKRSNAKPTDKDIVWEIIRRIKEEGAGFPPELPIGIRFVEQPGTTIQTYQRDIPEKRDPDQDAVRDEILRRLLERQRLRLPGMRAGK